MPGPKADWRHCTSSTGMHTMNSEASATPWHESGYSIIRYGVTITNCDAEPVHTPGCVQAHGALVVLRTADLTILQVSENSYGILGTAPTLLLHQPVSVILGEEGAYQLQQFLLEEVTECNPLFLCTATTDHNDALLDVTVHTVNGVVILEFESAAQRVVDGRTRNQDFYGVVRKTISRIARATSLDAFCDTTARAVRDLTGFDRVMVYKFHPDFHGEVVAENKRDGLGSWLGLHYPAEDIPVPARSIFKKVWVRPVPDIHGALAELEPLLSPDTGAALEMTYCALRGPSRMYTEYLQNMGVAACLTMPIRNGDKLWGLIACHHYADVRAVCHQLRSACELLAQVVSLQVDALQAREQLQYRLKIGKAHQQLVARLGRDDAADALRDSAHSLLDGIAADGMAMYHQGQWWLDGYTLTEDVLVRLAEWLFTRDEFRTESLSVFVTDSLSTVYPAAREWTAIASGLMALPLSTGRRELLLWFRTETIHTVHWAGNPDDKPTIRGLRGARLTPRRSFELFRESVRSRSLPWLDVEQETAAQLGTLVREVAASPAEPLATTEHQKLQLRMDRLLDALME